MTLQDIIEKLGFDPHPEEDIRIQGVCGLDDNLAEHLSFITHSKYQKEAQASKIPAFLTKKDLPIEGKINVYCDDPFWAIIQCAQLFEVPPLASLEGIHESVVQGQDTQIAEDVSIGANTILGDRVQIGRGTRILGNVSLLDDVKVGENCLIYPNVSIGHQCVLGDRVIIHSGSVVGCDGYGFYHTQGMHQKIPQVGRVVLESDVELGANCAIDRGRFTDTVIGAGTKFDNLVHIAHNVQIGQNCLLTAQTGIAGSSTLGNYVTMGGQSGIIGHLNIPEGVTLYAKSLITKSVQEPGVYAGIPARPLKLWQRAIAQLYKLTKR